MYSLYFPIITILYNYTKLLIYLLLIRRYLILYLGLFLNSAQQTYLLIPYRLSFPFLEPLYYYYYSSIASSLVRRLMLAYAFLPHFPTNWPRVDAPQKLKRKKVF